MAAKPLPPVELLLQLLRYEPNTGLLYWRERTPQMFKDGKQNAAHNCARWNSRHAGRKAFTVKNSNRHWSASVAGYGKLLAHRVIWKMVVGEDAVEIDHINGDGFDNRIENLRNVSHKENCRNLALPFSNSSGVIGVSWGTRYKKWRSQIKIDGKFISLGLFQSFENAVAARKRAETRYLFHTNHGRMGIDDA